MSKRAKSRRLEPIGGVIAELMQNLGLADQLREYQAVKLWEKAVGERVARHTEAYAIDRGRLLVFADSHVWIQELQFLKALIIKKLNAELGSELVKDISFSIARRKSN